MKTQNEIQLIKLAADSLDLLILRNHIATAMTSGPINIERMNKLAYARDLLVELYMDAGLEALHGKVVL